MDITPSQITAATFRTVRKGYHPDEVDAFLAEVATTLEACRQQSTAMEARARAAVARLQELQAAQAASSDTEPITSPGGRDDDTGDHVEHDDLSVSPDEAETISRTLLLAQRTADTTVAAAEAEAERIKHDAETEAEATIDSTREMSAQILEDARVEARAASEGARQAAENEVESLKARREFLIGDVDQLEAFLIDQRERLRGAARQIEALCDRVPDGLGDVVPPVLSASDDEPGDDTAELFVPPEAAGPFASADELAEALDGADVGSIAPAVDDDGPDQIADDAPDLPVRGESQASD